MTQVKQHRYLQTLVRLRWPRPIAVVFCGLIGVVFPASYGLLTGIPEPAIHDEFSYVLGADTFAHGRLTNPSPPLPEFFEAPHILVVPTYNSKYPPGQSLTLALGQALTGQPIWGVWIGCGLFAASLCWMLQAWSSRQWALAITILAVVTLGTSSYWAQSYWGGMVAASGAALLFGGMRRTLAEPRFVVSVLMAIGILLLANTRPYEGALVCLSAAFMGTISLVRDRRNQFRGSLRRIIVPISTVLAAGGIVMALYNRAVTGTFTSTPYEVHLRQYFHRGPFIFSVPHEPERAPGARLTAFQRLADDAPVAGTQLVVRVTVRLVVRLFASMGSAFGIFVGRQRPPYQGIFLWLALLMLVWFRSKRGFLVTAVFAAAGECLLWWYGPPYLVVLVAQAMIAAWTVAFALTYHRNQWARFIMFAIGVLALGQTPVLWWGPHYAAPFVPLLLAGIATTLQRLARRAARFRIAPVLGAAMLTLVGLHFLTLFAFSQGAAHEHWGEGVPGRADVKRRLEEQPGSHLVFVRYSTDYSLGNEWVYNPSSLNTARVIFAHDLGEGKNPELVAAFFGRVTWLAEVSPTEIRIRRYRRTEDGTVIR